MLLMFAHDCVFLLRVKADERRRQDDREKRSYQRKTWLRVNDADMMWQVQKDIWSYSF